MITLSMRFANDVIIAIKSLTLIRETTIIYSVYLQNPSKREIETKQVDTYSKKRTLFSNRKFKYILRILFKNIEFYCAESG